MKKIIKITKKILLMALVSLEILLINVVPAQAGLGSLLGGILGAKGSAAPNANGMLSQMEERYHLNKDSIKSFGESFNVSSQKNIAPEIKLMFAPQKPKLGEKMTANALATGFQDGAEDLYFTWYLKRKKCKEDKNPSEEILKLCDADDDGEITPNDWKVEAMRLIAANGFDTRKADYSRDSDNDGFLAITGGNNNLTQELSDNLDEQNYRCYINDHKSGTNYEIATVDPDDNGDEDKFECKDDEGNEGVMMCTSPYTLSCGVLEGNLSVPSQDLGTATATGGSTSTSGEDSSSTGGDVSVDLGIPAHDEPFEGITVESTDAHTDSGYAPFCDPNTDLRCPKDNPDCSPDEKIYHKTTCPDGATARCIIKEDLDLIDPSCSGPEGAEAGSANASLSDVTIEPDGAHPMSMNCYEDGRMFVRFPNNGMSYCGGDQGDCTVTLNTSDGLQSWSFKNPGGPEPECNAANPGCPGRYEDGTGFLWKSVGDSLPVLAVFFPADFSEGCGVANPGEQNIDCTTTLYGSEDVEPSCDHQFPKVDGFDIGDGEFDLDEEKFWGTDPNNPSTAGNGKTDEENVAGLGADKFTWNYLPGDKVGVIMEGTSFIPTKHDDSTKAITFAMPKNIFQENGSGCDLNDKETYVEEIKGYDVQIPITYVDLNECLDFNLVDPTNGDHAGKLETELSYSPENPNVGGREVNGTGNFGDSLIVTANTSNLTLDNSEVYYKWSVYGTTNPREDISLADGDLGGWEILSDESSFRSSNRVGALEGLGMDEFKMQLNDIDEEITHLRFYVELEEFYGDDSSGSTGTTSSGRADVIVKINNTGDSNPITILVGENDACASAQGACELLNNQIITASINDGPNRKFLWTLNGKRIEDLNGATVQGNTIKFLVQGKVGETFLLNVSANDTSSPQSGGNTGEKINLSRNLVIVEPRVAIGQNNELNRGDEGVECLSQVGSYSTAPAGVTATEQDETVADCRETVFTATGSFNVPVTYYPSFINSDNVLEQTFYVNGIPQESGTIDLTPYPAGSWVTVSYEAKYNPVIDSNNANELASKWGVSQTQSLENSKMSDTIMIKVGETNPQTGIKKTSKIIAGLAYNLPQQMIFIFRMMLTALVIIFTSGVLMSLTKKRYLK